MIYTCTINPSIDYVMWVDDIEIGDIKRTKQTILNPGGKGINVSVLLNNLEVHSTALGFIGGFTGKQLLEELTKYSYIHTDFIPIKGITRLNVVIESKKETRINADGPVIEEEEYQNLLKQMNRLTKDDVLILSGSVPSTLSQDIYHEIARLVTNKGALFILDTTKNHMLNCLSYHPFLIKPNLSELEEIFTVNITNHEEVIFYAKELQKMGALNVLVSLGQEGAILVTKDKVYHAKTVSGHVVNTVGAGDSMVAGFIYQYLNTHSLVEALRFGTSSGTATAFSVGFGNKDLIEEIINKIRITEL